MRKQPQPGLLAVAMWITTVVEFDRLFDSRVWHSYHLWLDLPTFLVALPIAIASTLEWRRRRNVVSAES